MTPLLKQRVYYMQCCIHYSIIQLFICFLTITFDLLNICLALIYNVFDNVFNNDIYFTGNEYDDADHTRILQFQVVQIPLENLNPDKLLEGIMNYQNLLKDLG